MLEDLADDMGRQGNYYLSMAILVTVFLGSGGMLLNRYMMEQRHETDRNYWISMFPDTGIPGAGEGTGIAGSGQSDHNRESDPGHHGGTVSEGRKTSEQRQESAAAAKIPPNEWKLWWGREAERRFTAYRTLEELNPDMVGWIRIEGTRIDYPVMQTRDNPDYYLHRDFNKKKSDYGIPYMAEMCHYEEPGTNLLIYGHHMRNGTMFAALAGYTDESFYRKHPYIQFDFVDREGSYEIAAVVRVDAAGDATPWQDLLFPAEETAWETAWHVVEGQSFYQTGVKLGYEDRLLALVTCEYTLKDGRLMVVAREIR